MESNNIVKILHTADGQVKNREINLYKSYENSLIAIQNQLIQTKAEIYVYAGDIFEYDTPNDSERKLVYKHLAEILKIETLKEFVFMNGNHDIIFSKKQLDSNKENNSFDTLNKFIETLTHELANKITYLKHQKQYVSKFNKKIGWLSYSIEDGLSNGNNFDWSNIDSNLYNITIFHDILRDYVEDTKLPVRKDKLEYLPYVDDFKTNLILAGDIHENYTKTVNGKTFIYPGSNVQRNFGEGTYVKIRKNSTIFKAAEKVTKLHTINLDTFEVLTEDLVLPCYLSYITLDLNSNKIVDNFLTDIETFFKAATFGINQTMIKLKLSSAYVKHEIEIFKLIERICSESKTSYHISTVYDKYVISTDGTDDNLELIDIDNENSNGDSSELNIEELKLNQEKLNIMFSGIVEQYRNTLMKEFNDDTTVNSILDNVKSLFAEQIEFSLSAVPNFKIDLESIETKGFMNLDANIINLDIPGLTKINGTNGIGKTTLYSMIRFAIKGIVFEGLKANNKKQNALMVFNDKNPNQDTIIVRMFAKINNTSIAITRIVNRKWKTSATEENKLSIDWKTYIADVTSSVKLDVMTKDGQKTYTGDEAENLIEKWFGNVTTTILILNQFKIDSMLNLNSDKLQQLVLDYIGVDYLTLLEENLPSIKNQYNLVKPKTSMEDLKIDYINKTKTKDNGLASLKELKTQIDDADKNVKIKKEEFATKNNELINLGNIPEIIKTLKTDLDTKTTEKNNFQTKEKKELPLFQLTKPVKEDISNEETNLNTQVELYNNTKSELDKLLPTYNERLNKFIETVKEEKNKIPGQLNDIWNYLISENNEFLIESKNNVDNKFHELQQYLGQIKESLTQTQNTVVLEINSIGLEIQKIIDRNTSIDTEISSGVCEKCDRSFGDDFESHKNQLLDEKQNNLKSIEELNNHKDTKTKYLSEKVVTILKLYSTYYDKSIERDLQYFRNLPEFESLPFNATIVLLETLVGKYNYFNDINTNCEKQNYDYFVNLFASTVNQDEIEKQQLMRKRIDQIHHCQIMLRTNDVIIEKLLRKDNDYSSYNWNNIELLEICKLGQSCVEYETTCANISNVVTTLKTKIDSVNNTYNTSLSNYNTEFEKHNNSVSTILSENEAIEKHNNSLSLIINDISNLNIKILDTELQLPLYNSLKESIDKINQDASELETQYNSLSEQYNKLDKELLTIDNEIENINNELNTWVEYRKNLFIYGIYEKLIKTEFRDSVFEYYRKFLNKSLNVLLEDMNFKLYWDKSGDLYMIEIGNGIQTFRPVQLTSGMQTCFLGLSLIYSIHMLNVKNDISHLFIDEISGQLNNGKELTETETQSIVNYQEQLTLLLSKFTNKKVFIIDHVIQNLFQTMTYEVVKGENGFGKYIIVD